MSELLSPFPASDFINLSKSKILAEIELAKGKEGLMKSFTNNKKGIAYASGISAMEVEDMIKLRSNYPENVAQAEDLVITAGIDVQHNRFALVVIAWGRNGNCRLILWKELFGNVFNPEDTVWIELTNLMHEQILHVSGKYLPISAISIDSGDGSTTELVYRWVNMMNMHLNFNGNVRATKGVRDLKFSQDEIYSEPPEPDSVTYKQIRRTLAETMGVKLYKLGAHRCHDEILRRIGMNLIAESKHDRFYFNDTSYGDFEEQMTSCRKLIDMTSCYTKEVYKLVSGRRKEAMDCCKNAFHAAYAIGLRDYTNTRWQAIEDYLFDNR
jgi:phage terminase large subunit GpA-like protein